MATSNTYHFAIVAINSSGQTLSNSLSVDVLYPPGTFTLSSDAGTPDDDGSFSLSWTNSLDAENYTVFLFDKPITEYNGSLTNLADETGTSPYSINVVSGTYYFKTIVVSQPEFTKPDVIDGTADDTSIESEYTLLGNKSKVWYDQYDDTSDETLVNF